LPEDPGHQADKDQAAAKEQSFVGHGG
jgi:hypothetical protein